MSWRKTSVLCVLLVGSAIAMASRARAETIKVLTEEFPPYNYTEDARITGFSTEVVQAVLKEAKIQGDFQSMPWARAYETAPGPHQPRARVTRKSDERHTPGNRIGGRSSQGTPPALANPPRRRYRDYTRWARCGGL